MIYKYIRFSTEKQDEQQQENAINTYLKSKEISIKECETFRDEGISGGVSYKKRNLFGLVNKVEQGDTIIVSELSRLTRGGIVDLSSMIDEFFKPKGICLIICNTGMVIDCTNMTGMNELILSMLASFAKMEKESIQERTKNALDARQKQLKENGGFKNKSGIFVTGFGSASELYCNGDKEKKTQILIEARRKASIAKKEKALNNPNNKRFIAYFKGNFENNKIEWEKIPDRLNSIGLKTASGMEFNINRAKAMYNKLKNEIL